MQRVSVVAKLTAKEGQEQRVEKELLDLVEKTRQEKGCINYDLHVSLDKPGTFFFYENWVSKGCLDNHFETPHLTRLVKLQEELFSCPPEISVLKMVSEPK